MSKKFKPKKELQKTFNAVIKALGKQKDKRLRKQTVEFWNRELQNLTAKLKTSIHPDADHLPDTREGARRAGTAISPSPALVEEMSAAVTAS